MGDRCYEHRARLCKSCDDEGRVLPKLQQLMAEPSPFVSGGSLTEAEREALTCDCEKYEHDEDWPELWCPFHADRPGFDTGVSAGEMAARVEKIIDARVQAERERIAREIESRYLGPDSGRQHDGRDAPDAHLRNAFDEGLEYAARIAWGEGR